MGKKMSKKGVNLDKMRTEMAAMKAARSAKGGGAAGDDAADGGAADGDGAADGLVAKLLLQNSARVQQMDSLKQQMVADAELLQQVLQMVSRDAEQPGPTVRLDDLDERLLL
jgi:hypothetical protein